MSEKNPECPLYNPSNCKEYCNPKVCAFVKKDKICLKKRKPESPAKHPSEAVESNNEELEICQVKLPE
jgi:hypothetical protein